MKRLWIVGPMLMSMGAASAVLAEDMADLIHSRHEHFKAIGSAMKDLSDELKAGSPSVAKIQVDAKKLNELAPQLPSWFPVGSGPRPGIKTRAKALIWAKPEEFKSDAQGFIDAANHLNAAAATGDLAAIRTNAGAVGKACKTCHETFRERED